MTMTITTKIEAVAHHGGISEPSEGYGSVDYRVTLAVGEHRVDIDCWGHCGWLAPGASADIDGSGLAAWGDSQPGGWSVCDGDGAYDGRPRVIADRSPECGDPVCVGATHLGAQEITPDMVPGWAAALAALAATPEDAGEWVDRESDAADIRAAVAEAIGAALAVADADCPEPSAAEVWDALGSTAEVDGVDCVRVGRWIGCPLVAWRAGERIEYEWWPKGSPQGALDAAAVAASSAIDDAVEAILASDDD